MRCGLLVEKKEVLAVVLADIAESLSHSISEIREALEEPNWARHAKKIFNAQVQLKLLYSVERTTESGGASCCI